MVVREVAGAAGGSGGVSGEALISDVDFSGVIRKPIVVSGGISAITTERVDADIVPAGVIFKRVGSGETVGAVVGEVFVAVNGEPDVIAVLLGYGVSGELRETEELRGGAEIIEASVERVA